MCVCVEGFGEGRVLHSGLVELLVQGDIDKFMEKENGKISVLVQEISEIVYLSDL